MSTSDAGKGYIQRPIQNNKAWDEQYERNLGMLAPDWPKCSDCGEPMFFEVNEPFAFCTGDCVYTTEWGNGRPSNWEQRQRPYLRRMREQNKPFIESRDPGDENDHKA